MIQVAPTRQDPPLDPYVLARRPLKWRRPDRPKPHPPGPQEGPDVTAPTARAVETSRKLEAVSSVRSRALRMQQSLLPALAGRPVPLTLRASMEQPLKTIDQEKQGGQRNWPTPRATNHDQQGWPRGVCPRMR